MTDARKGRSKLRILAMVVVGLIAGIVSGLLGAGISAAVIAWAAACLTYLVWVWAVVVPYDGESTRTHAQAEDPSRSTSQFLLLLASLASLFIVGLTIAESNQAKGILADVLAGLAVFSVALSWFFIHTLFMLRYAVLYYNGDEEGGIDFNQAEPPDYLDFAYLSFDLGMTFQVSDTTVTSSPIRHMVLRHSLLSYLFGSVILATLINLVAGLAS
ncbi:MAG: hypothetical protein JWP75_2052 [Frondihabitans sp.]|nr:hypothetical protein [Frondihabitans sp.]